VTTVDSLLLDTGVPPEVSQNDVAAEVEVEAHSAHALRQQQDIHVAALFEILQLVNSVAALHFPMHIAIRYI